MNIRHVRGVAVAGALTCGMVVFAQPSQATASSKWTVKQQKRPITLVGCLQRMSDYRHDRPSLAGEKAGKEFVLVNATLASESTGSAPAEDVCANKGDDSTTYELTGSGERDLRPLVGRRVEITGMLKSAWLYVDPVTGKPTARTTGGAAFGGELHLREVNVISGREVIPEAVAEVAPSPPPAEPTITAEAEIIQPAEIPQPAETVQQPVATTGTEKPARLPKTASPLPLVGLFGLLSLVGAFGIRTLSRQENRS